MRSQPWLFIPLAVSLATTPSLAKAPFAFNCDEYFQNLDFKRISWFTKASGITMGITQGVVTTWTGGYVIPPAAFKLLPFFNESANVLSTATGAKWLYSGISKQAADGIALGAMVGRSIQVAGEQGIFEGGATLGIFLGLTYWFPNKYFHQLMYAIPNYMPKGLKRAAKKPVGQGVIGISLIVLLEQAFVHAEALAHSLIRLFAENERSIASGAPTLTAYQALALTFIDLRLQHMGVSENERLRALASSGVLKQLAKNDSPHSAVVCEVLQNLKELSGEPVLCETK